MRKDVKVGERYGKLLVVAFSGLNKRKEREWSCLCDCGSLTIAKTRNLTIGKTKSCGCIPRGYQRQDLTGMKVNGLTAIRAIGTDGFRGTLWECRCDCGGVTVVRSSPFKRGKIRSCGCFEQKRARGAEHYMWDPARTPEERKAKRATPEYAKWQKETKRVWGYKCFVCESRRRLVSHHIDPFWSHPDSQTDLSNGICLCDPCHLAFHARFGTKEATRSDFTEWLTEKGLYEQFCVSSGQIRQGGTST